ncbi:nucleolar protein 16 isoform X3 [Carlito syrichta]|uniref:Nucleolar protein 16 n=1 Tax=Carlito syrichta TaxID=1868482 RepID=A0A3Q0DJN0_CARSF|nr:nucleolar protein 16 isoform X3 [Carlito syrichta]
MRGGRRRRGSSGEGTGGREAGDLGPRSPAGDRPPVSLFAGSSHIRHAWDHAKSVRQNLAEMGLALDPNKAVPLRKRKVKAMEVDMEERPKELVRKPYVLNELEAEASLPEKKDNTLSRDLIDYVRYMVENHGEDYKAMARDEKNYYQDTPKQIRNKINVYRRFYPAEWQAFRDSLQKSKMEVG